MKKHSRVSVLILLVFCCSHLAQGKEAQLREISIGLASNFSDPSSSSSNPYGNYFRDGAKLALLDVDKKLKDKGIKIVTKEFDYGVDQMRVLDAANQAVKSDVLAVLGYNFSSHALLAAPIHQKEKLPMLTPSASADRIGRFGSYIHVGCFDNSFQGKILAEVAKKRLKAHSAAIIVAADCAYCQDLANAFKADFEKHKSETNVYQILEDDKEFGPIVENIKTQNPDVILVPNQELTSSRVISALLTAGIKKPFLGGDGWGNTGDEFFKILAGKTFEGYSVSHWHSSINTKRSLEFMKEYKAKFGKQPNDTSVLAYDSMLILAEAVVNAKELSREGIEKSLNNIKTFDGVTGHFIFEKSGSPRKSLLLLKSKGSKFRVIQTIEPVAYSGEQK